MANLFSGLKSEGLEQSEDRLGGGFQAVDSKIYNPATIKMLYTGEAKSGAMNLTLVADLGGGKEYRETVYITKKPTDEQKAKKLPGDNFFVKDGKKQPLPGFTLINDLCVIATSGDKDGAKELHQLGDTVEEKVINLYDFDLKKEVPTKVNMVMGVIGKPVALGILKIRENKQKQGTDGQYHAIAEEREVNRIDKIFHPEAKLTVAEARDGKTESGFWDAWTKKNEGQVRDEREIKDGQAPAAAGGPPKAGGSAPSTTAPKTSLFGKK